MMNDFTLLPPDDCSAVHIVLCILIYSSMLAQWPLYFNSCSPCFPCLVYLFNIFVLNFHIVLSYVQNKILQILRARLAPSNRFKPPSPANLRLTVSRRYFCCGSLLTVLVSALPLTFHRIYVHIILSSV